MKKKIQIGSLFANSKDTNLPTLKTSAALAKALGRVHF